MRASVRLWPLSAIQFVPPQPLLARQGAIGDCPLPIVNWQSAVAGRDATGAGERRTAAAQERVWWQGGLASALAVALVPLCASASPVSLTPTVAQPGAVLVATVRPPQGRPMTEVRASLLGARPAFVEVDGAHVALVPVPAEADAGRTPFYVKLLSGASVLYSDVLYVHVRPRAFPTQHLTMSASTAKGMSNPAWRKERLALNALFDRTSPKRLWSGAFQLPLKGRLSSPWGRIRYVNGKRWGSQHQGADLAAAKGTPVASDATGVIVLAQNWEMRGGTVVVDHGCGLFSAYNHLSRLDVAAGQRVTRGQTLGAVGATGFATGPHLHWEVRVGRTPVDPLLLTKQAPSLPEGPPEPAM